MFIKNTTPYSGKLRLRFEKMPWYTDERSVLNNIHLDLGFTKLVSRIYPFKTENGYNMLDSEKIKLIVENTGGKIGVHEWWECVSKKTGRRKKKYTEPDERTWEIIDNRKLPEAFVSNRDEIYIGSVEDAWWYYKNDLTVYQEYPQGVALELDEFEKITGVYGYSHRGGCMFELGHRIFDGKYVPKKEDYPEWQWAGFERDFKNYNPDYLLEGEKKKIEDVIPFNMRGKKVIETWDDAIQAAINLSKYLG